MKNTFTYRQTVLKLVADSNAGAFSWAGLQLYSGDVLESITIAGQTIDLLPSPVTRPLFSLIAHNDFIADSLGAGAPPPMQSVPIFIDLPLAPVHVLDVGGSYHALWDATINTFLISDPTTQHLILVCSGATIPSSEVSYNVEFNAYCHIRSPRIFE